MSFEWPSMFGQEREHAVRRHQMPDQGGRIEQFPIGALPTQHETRFSHLDTNSHRRLADYSVVSYRSAPAGKGGHPPL